MRKVGLGAGLAILVAAVIASCSVFRDDPATLVLDHIKALINMPEAEYRLRKKNIALREQTSIGYLRARIIQDATFTFNIEAINRPRAKQREVTVSVSEKRSAGPSHERARYWAFVELNADDEWQVISFQLVE